MIQNIFKRVLFERKMAKKRKRKEIKTLREDTEAGLREIINKLFEVPACNVRDESEWQELGADSSDKVELMMDVEDRYKIQITDEASGKMRTFGALADYVAERRKERGDSLEY